MATDLNYPFDPAWILRKKRSIRRELLTQSNFLEKRVAIIGGSTTSEVKDMLELFLLDNDIKPTFYESDYNRYYEDIMLPNISLETFKPDLIYIHISTVNISTFPTINDEKDDIKALVSIQINRFTDIWDKAISQYSCSIIQNNFELPHYRVLGNLDCYDIRGHSNFINKINASLNEEAEKRKNVYLNDINYLSSWFGLERWYDKFFWHSYKYAMHIEAIPYVAHSVSSIITAIFGKAKKCLVLDLDNTLWGGVIGDDGLAGIQLGNETPQAEAFMEFQRYIKILQQRGVLLAVASKNDNANAKEGFTHPDSILKIEDFSAFRANWEPKPNNIKDIAKELNIGIDSIVFVDDNPLERELVKVQEPSVKVPDIGDNVIKYINILDKSGLFETVSLSLDDKERTKFYLDNTKRYESEALFKTYEDFLASLEMTAEIKPFIPIYLDRITQLINKTNQFNLTTKRYTFTEIEIIANDNNYIKLYGRLVDKFGDNGLVSVIIGGIKKEQLQIDLWIMSCRVLKRGMEYAMFDKLIEFAIANRVKTIVGEYTPSPKNAMVSNLFKDMGFTKSSNSWQLNLANYKVKNKIIKINESGNN